jgi:hypothetical protein
MPENILSIKTRRMRPAGDVWLDESQVIADESQVIHDLWLDEYSAYYVKTIEHKSVVCVKSTRVCGRNVTCVTSPVLNQWSVKRLDEHVCLL